MQLVVVLVQSSIPRLPKAEKPLDDSEHMFNARTDARLSTVGFFLCVAQWAVAISALVGEVPRMRSLFANDVFLIAVCRIAPDPRFIAVQEIAELFAIMHVRRRRYDGMDDFLFAVHADMRLHAEVPLVALLGRVHLGISFFVFIFRRTRRMNDARIHNRAAGYLHAAIG